MNQLKLYLPVRPFNLNLNFGEIRDVYTNLGLAGHDGLDIQAYSWQPIYSASEGYVWKVNTEIERGLGIDIVTSKPVRFLGSPYNTMGDYHAKVRYWHLAALNVKEKEYVKPGQLIGWADNTGNSSGDHLHFELKPVDEDHDMGWHNVFQDNGFFGAVDPTPYLSQLTALEINTFLTRISYQLMDYLNRSKLTG